MKHKTKQWKYTNQKWNTKHTAILKKEIVVLKDLNQCDCFFVQYDTIHILFILSFLGENKNFSFNPVFRDKNIDFFCQSYFSGRKWEMQIMQRYIQWEKTAICFLHFCVSFGFLFLIIFVCLNCRMATDADNCLVSESEALPASDYLSLSRYLIFFSFTSQTLSDIWVFFPKVSIWMKKGLSSSRGLS